MKTRLAFLLLNLLSFSALAQHQFGLKGNAGVNYFTTRIENPSGFEQKFSILPALQGGLFYSYSINEKLSLGTELLWMAVEGKETMTITNTDINGIPNGNFTTVIFYRDISYLGIPLYAGYTWKKWNFNLGLQVNYHLRSAGSENGYGVDQNGQAIEWNFDGGELNVDKFNFGVRPGLSYKLTDMFSIEANYFGGINNILNAPSLNDTWKWKVHQLTVGLRISFGQNRTGEETNNSRLPISKPN